MNTWIRIVILIVFQVQLARAHDARCVPSYAQVHTAALRHAQFEPQMQAEWIRQARRAAWLPRVQIGASQGFDRSLDLDTADRVSVSSSGIVVGPSASSLGEGNDRSLDFSVRLTWYLDRTVYHRDHLQIRNVARAERKEAQDLLKQVNRAYAEWLTWRVRSGPQAHLRELHARATLDALTGGVFARQFESMRERSPSCGE